MILRLRLSAPSILLAPLRSAKGGDFSGALGMT